MGLLSQHNTLITAVIAQQRAELVHCICVVGTWIRGCPGVIGTNKPHHPGDKVIALPGERRRNLGPRTVIPNIFRHGLGIYF